MKSAPLCENFKDPARPTRLAADKARAELRVPNFTFIASFMAKGLFHSPEQVTDDVNWDLNFLPPLLLHPVEPLYLQISFRDGTMPLPRGSMDYSGSERTELTVQPSACGVWGK